MTNTGSGVYIGDDKIAFYFETPQGMKIQLKDQQSKNIIFESFLSGQQESSIIHSKAYQHGFDSKRKLKAALVLALAELDKELIHPDLVEAAKLMKEEKRRDQSSVTIEAENERGYRIIDSYTFDPAIHKRLVA